MRFLSFLSGTKRIAYEARKNVELPRHALSRAPDEMGTALSPLESKSHAHAAGGDDVCVLLVGVAELHYRHVLGDVLHWVVVPQGK